MESAILDPLDRQLLHALQLDGRAPFSKVAAVLDVSDRTVARRFARLRATVGIRVSAVPNSDVTEHAEWLVRVRVRPHATAGLAHALAERADTAWVTVLSSGVEIVCLFRVPDGGPAPLTELSRKPDVTVVAVQRVLRHLMRHRWAWPHRGTHRGAGRRAAVTSPRAPRPDPADRS